MRCNWTLSLAVLLVILKYMSSKVFFFKGDSVTTCDGKGRYSIMTSGSTDTSNFYLLLDHIADQLKMAWFAVPAGLLWCRDTLLALMAVAPTVLLLQAVATQKWQDASVQNRAVVAWHAAAWRTPIWEGMSTVLICTFRWSIQPPSSQHCSALKTSLGKIQGFIPPILSHSLDKMLLLKSFLGLSAKIFYTSIKNIVYSIKNTVSTVYTFSRDLLDIS